MTERWLFTTDFGEYGVRRVESPWNLIREWRRMHVRVTGFYTTPMTDGMTMKYVKGDDGNFHSVWSPWQMRADVLWMTGRRCVHRGEIYRACVRPKGEQCCSAAALLGETCPRHPPRKFLPCNQATLRTYLSSLPGVVR